MDFSGLEGTLLGQMIAYCIGGIVIIGIVGSFFLWFRVLTAGRRNRDKLIKEVDSQSGEELD